MNVCAFLTMLMFVLPVAIAQETKPVDPQVERQNEIKEAEREAAALPQVKADSVQRLVKFFVEENMLAAKTELPVGDQQQARVIVPGLSGIVRLQRYGPQDNADENAGRNFQLIQRDMTGPGAGDVFTTVSAVGGRLNVSRDAEANDVVWNIQLIQDPPPPAGTQPDEDPVRLLIHRTGPANANDLDLKLSAKSFVELRRKNPREVNQYFRPIIRDLKQEAAVFGVPAPVAWQVLGTNYQPDAQMAQRVSAIVAKLDADNFRERENALDELKKLGQPAAIVLSGMDRSKLSLQQSSGVESFLAEFAPLAPSESERLVNDKDFLIDVLYNDDPTLQKLALGRLSKLTGRKLQLDPNLDDAARADAIAKLRDELMPSPASAPTPQPATRMLDSDHLQGQL
jgi:hypothetical protein